MIDRRRCSHTYQLFTLNVCILPLYILFPIQKYLFFVHVYKFGFILVTLSDVREWKNRIIYFCCCAVLSDLDIIVVWPRSMILFHSMHALFLCENFQTNILQGKAEGRSSILIFFDWVCLKILTFTEFLGQVCCAAPWGIFFLRVIYL